MILRRAIIEAGLVCSPDKDGDRGDVKVFSLLPSFFSLGVDDTLDSLGLLTMIQNQLSRLEIQLRISLYNDPFFEKA